MNRERVIIYVLLLALAAAQDGFAIARHTGSRDEDYITFGNHFTSTVAAGYINQNAFHFRASAVVIDPHWVLCSAHEYFDSSGLPLYSGAFISLDSTFIANPSRLLIADRWFRYPDSTSDAYGPDMALLYFETPIAGVTPAVRFRGILKPRSLVSITGYGRTGTPQTGYLPLDYQRRGCHNFIDRFGDGITFPEYTLFSDFSPPQTTEFHPLGGVAAPGDSGGGWYNQDGLLIGVSVEVGTLAPVYDNFTIAQNITYFNTWIDTVMADINRTQSLNLLDFAALSACWMSTAGDIRFKGGWDLVSDGRINLLDLLVFTDRWINDQSDPTKVVSTSNSGQSLLTW
ncbi:MAG: trypsin-like serine protease [Sedimentisphaerales bacterium]|nr:trypsin-like serine protease [Sedimentisphaerales bacterium]